MGFLAKGHPWLLHQIREKEGYPSIVNGPGDKTIVFWAAVRFQSSPGASNGIMRRKRSARKIPDTAGLRLDAPFPCNIVSLRLTSSFRAFCGSLAAWQRILLVSWQKLTYIFFA